MCIRMYCRNICVPKHRYLVCFCFVEKQRLDVMGHSVSFKLTGNGLPVYLVNHYNLRDSDGAKQIN